MIDDLLDLCCVFFHPMFILTIAGIIVGCTVIYRSQHVDLHEDRSIAGTNRVTEVDLAPR